MSLYEQAFTKNPQETERVYGKLKPCPFCGETGIRSYRNGNSHYVYCSACKASPYKFPVMTAIYIVAKAWNKRV